MFKLPKAKFKAGDKVKPVIDISSLGGIVLKQGETCTVTSVNGIFEKTYDVTSYEDSSKWILDVLEYELERD